MIKKFAIGLAVFVIVIVAQTSWVQNSVSQMFSSISGMFESFVGMPERSRIMKLRDDFMRNNMSLQPHQTDYVIEVTDTVENLEKFHTLYCLRKDKNPYIYGRNLENFCALIEQSDLIGV